MIAIKFNEIYMQYVNFSIDALLLQWFMVNMQLRIMHQNVCTLMSMYWKQV